MLYHMFQNDFAMFLSRRYTLPQTMNVECGIKLNWIKREKGLVSILLRTGTSKITNVRKNSILLTSLEFNFPVEYFLY